MENDCIRSVFQTLLDKNNTSVQTLSAATGISRQTLYSMLKKTSKQADLENLKKIADYFHENLSIFCGLEQYERPIQLNKEQKHLLHVHSRLNTAGRNRLMEYADELMDNPKYKK